MIEMLLLPIVGPLYAIRGGLLAHRHKLTVKAGVIGYGWDIAALLGHGWDALTFPIVAMFDADRKRIETMPITGNQGGKTFNISRPEKINEFLMGGLSIALDASPAATFSMLDDNGVEVTYDKTLMGQITKFISNSKAPALKRYNARKAAIEAARDAAELAAVDTDLTKP